MDGNRTRIRSFKKLIMEKLEINDKFTEALNYLNNTQENVFITGNAGTGKSTLLAYFRETTKKNIAVLATTGVAALNIDGQTIHSFFKLPPNIVKEKVLEHKLSDKRKKLIAHLDMIIIDEASMLRSDLLDCIDVSLRHHRQEETLAFGGVQMVFIGDLYQLPPVVSGDEEREIFKKQYSSPYFFSAKSSATSCALYFLSPLTNPSDILSIASLTIFLFFEVKVDNFSCVQTSQLKLFYQIFLRG